MYLIIDSGNQENIISKGYVERLRLEMETHPNPYTIGWIKEVGGIRVNKHCNVSFSTGKYNDEVYCDVVDMDACHILLGRLMNILNINFIPIFCLGFSSFII